MSLVLVEAMACGLPVLTTRSARGAEIVGDGEWVLETPNDSVALAGWVVQLAKDTELRLSTGQRAQKIAEEH